MLLIRILDVTVVDAMLPRVPIEVSDSFELARDNREGVLRADGDRVTLASGTKMPYLSGHSKYLQIWKKNKIVLFQTPRTAPNNRSQ